LDYNRIMVVRQ